MTTQNTILIHRLNTYSRVLAALGIAAAAVTLLPAADDLGKEHANHQAAAPAKLVEIVRAATRQFIDVNAATRANYQPLFGCISGPEHGAMGVHFINGTLVGDGEVDVSRPEALIYEPLKDGGMRLVGVEFIVDAAAWMSRHTSPPMLEGQAFHLVNSPNRYGLPAFFELHVWAWQHNPKGAFADWNTRVSCEGQ